MTPDTVNLEERADADRRRHENDLLALLLLLLHQSANRADSALNLGADPFAAAADPLTGNTALRIRPAWPSVARKLIAADVAGFERTVRVIRTGTIENELSGYTPAVDYSSIARQAVGRLVAHTRTAIADGIRRSFTEAKPVRRAVDEAFGAAGLVISGTSKAWLARTTAETLISGTSKAWLARTTAETLVGFAFESGYVNGWYRSDVRDVLTGFAYSSVLDANTTEICRAYDGVQLPINDVWWRYHWPKNHWGCRAVVVPRFGKFTPTENPPWQPQPMGGFGVMPAVAAGISVQPAAA